MNQIHTLAGRRRESKIGRPGEYPRLVICSHSRKIHTLATVRNLLMRVVICGAGEVGRHIAEVLGNQGHGVTMIDTSSVALKQFEEQIDTRSLRGSACHAAVLRDAGIEKSDLMVAATDKDEINLLAASIAKRLGARRVVARIHHRAYIDTSTLDYGKALNIDYVICPEYLTAQVIARNLRSPGAMAIERFAQDNIELQRYAVAKDSPAVGIKLIDLGLPQGVRIATIESGTRAVMPEPASVLQPDDIVTIIGETKHSEKVRKLFLQPKATVVRVAIMGGTAMAVWLSRALHSRHFSIRLFETERNRAEELANKLEHVTVIQGDPTDPALFREEHLEECDAFVAVSADDEHNIIGAVQAKELGTAMVIVVIAQPTYVQLLERIGVDQPYSPRTVAAREVLKLIDESPVRSLATLADGIAEVYELDPARSGQAVGRPLREVRLPRQGFVAAVQRGTQVFVPGAQDVIQVGDILIVIGPQGVEKKLRDLFVGR